MTQTLPDARWSCHGCGACCRDFRLGPVEPQVVDDLRARGAARLAGREDWAVREVGPGGEEGWFLRHVDGACIFLLPDNRCAVHAEWGAEAKPGFCREFPYRRLRDPNGDVLVIRAECAGFHASHVDGEPLADQTGQAAAIPQLWPTPEFKPDGVAVLPGVGLGLADWMTLEASLLKMCEVASGEIKTPLGAEPEDVARSLLTAALKAIRRPPQQGRTELAARAVREAMRMVANAAITQESEATETWQAALVREVLGILDAQGERRALAPATRGYLLLLLRQAILGKHLVSAGSFAAMLGRFVFEVDLVRTSPGVGAVTPAEASAVLVPWLRFADNPMVLGMLRRATPALIELSAS